MQATRHSQPVFAESLLSLVAPVAAGVQIYRNNVIAGLIDALRDTFPAVLRLVGNEFFDAMAKSYVTAQPPRSPILLKYGETFPDFISTFEPAHELPYLSDVGEIEFAWLKAYHALEKAPLDRSAFLPIGKEAAPQLRLALHPSAQILRSRFPSVTIWHANRENEVIEEINLDRGGEDVLIVRPAADVNVHLLAPGSAVFLRALAAEKTLTEATLEATAEHPDFDLTFVFSGAIDAGALAAFRVPKEASCR